MRPTLACTVSAAALLLIGTAHPVRGQDLLSALPLELNGAQFVRASDGAYFTTRNIDDAYSGFVIAKYDASLQPLWSKEVHGEIVGARNLVRTSDGGVLCCGSTGMTFHEGENTTNKLPLIRFNADGSVAWSRTLDMYDEGNLENAVMPVGQEGGVFGWGNPLAISDDGAIFINMVNVIGGARSIMKLNADGSPAWHVGQQGTGDIRMLGAPLPDDEGGCFFIGEGGYPTSYLWVGRIHPAGTTAWVLKVSHDFSEFATGEAHLGPDGDLLIGGKDGSNAFLMKMDLDGVPSWFRLFAPVQTIDGYSVNGFEVGSDGRMAFVGSGSLPGEAGGAVITFIDTAGHLASAQMAGHFTQSTQDCSFQPRSSLALGDRFMVQGDYVREDTIFGFTGHQPFIHTSSFTDVVDCYFTPWSFAELASLSIDTQEDGSVSPLPIPDHSDQVLTITDVDPVVAANLCASTGIADRIAAPALVLGSNVLAQGEPLRVPSTNQGLVRVLDMAGRSIGSHQLKVGEDLQVATASWTSGIYVVELATYEGARVARSKVVVR